MNSIEDADADAVQQPEEHLKGAQSLLASNSQLTEKLFPSSSTDCEDSESRNIARIARQRRQIQLTHSPYAPRKRPRISNSSSNAPCETTETQVIPLHNSISNNNNDSNKEPRNNTVIKRTQGLLEEEERHLQTDHPKWKPYRIISGHLGWVRTLAFDPSNKWFASGSADRTLKLWDSASGKLKLTLTGHISAVRSISISTHNPYLFSVGEDKTVKCWDLEQNKVIRNYHGHLSGVYTSSLHPTLNLLFTGSRDSTIRAWDIRTRQQVHVLSGHRDTVNCIFSQNSDPQLVSGSIDSTVRCWDIRNGKCVSVLTNHKKGIRSLVKHQREFSFCSSSVDGIKKWALPNGIYMKDFKQLDNKEKKGHGGKIINALAVNDDDVLVSGGDDGSLKFWDYSTGFQFDHLTSKVQPGSLECEAGIQALTFDISGSRLVTGETDKTIRMYRST